MAALSFTTLSAPQGQINGQFTPWVIAWQIPNQTPNGYVLQHMQIIFQGVHDCGLDNLSDDEIWSRMDYTGPPRLDYWEAWQYRDGIWLPISNTDSWGFSQPGSFYSNDGEGTVIFNGMAGFYEGEDLVAFCGEWGTDGNNDGSPMSGALMSTTQTPDLPNPPTIQRSMRIEWHVCGCDSDDVECRKTSVTTAIAPQNA